MARSIRKVRTRIVLLSAIALAALAALGVSLAFVVASGDDAPELRASTYQTPIPAPPTSGTGFDGTPVSVPREGRPALVTFLFANCPTVCPLVGNQISKALDRLTPEEREELDVVAISVDPKGDTPEAVAAFLERYRLAGRMQYITGTREQLEPLWKDWMIVAQPDGNATDSLHTARVVLVDRDGRQLGSYPGGLPIPPDDLAADIRAIIGG